MSQTMETAKHMLGNGWYDRTKLADELNLNRFTAAQLMQRIRRSSYYDCEDRKVGGIVYVRVVAVRGFFKRSYESKLWRMAIFGVSI